MEKYKKIWVISTILLIFCTIFLALSTIFFDLKLSNLKNELTKNEDYYDNRLDENYQTYNIHLSLANYWRLSYQLYTLKEKNISQDILNSIEKNIQFYELMALGNWKIIMTGDLASPEERESWKNLSIPEIDSLKDKFEDNETLTLLKDKIKNYKKDIDFYEQWKWNITFLIIILQTFGLIGINYADFYKK